MQHHPSVFYPSPVFSLPTSTSPVCPLSVTGSVPCRTASDDMTVCRPKSFLYVCTQSTLGVCGEGIIHSSSSHTHTCFDTSPPSPCTHTFIIIINNSDANTINPSYSIHLTTTSKLREEGKIGGGEGEGERGGGERK